MKVKEFIEQVLIDDIGKMQGAGLHYLSFSIIASGIEFLGACLDDKDFNKSGLSEIRFKKGIDELFDQKYKKEANELYKDLRCGFAHIVGPQGNISLTENKHIGKSTHKNLDRIKSGNLILIAEDFYRDFKNACDKVIEKIEKHELNSKVYKDFLIVPSDNINIGDATSIPTSGAPQINRTQVFSTSAAPQINVHITKK